jgi:hypothetical protein
MARLPVENTGYDRTGVERRTWGLFDSFHAWLLTDVASPGGREPERVDGPDEEGLMAEASTKRVRAAQCRQAAERSSSASDRAFFRRQALRLDHQAKELDGPRPEDDYAETAG